MTTDRISTTVTQSTRCPRCRGPLGTTTARSRMTQQRDITICTPCAQDKAATEAAGRAPVPPGERPVTKPE